jgi:hypothetical protein
MADRVLQNFVNDKFTDASDGRTSDVIDPSTGEVYAQAPISSRQDVDAAMQAAANAFEGWRDSTPSERSLALLKFADAVEKRAGEVIEAETRNTGKPVALTASEEIPPAGDQIRFFAGAARVLEGLSAGEYMRDHTSMIRRARRRLRPGDSVELPDDDGRVEVRARHRGGQRRRAQAVGHNPGVHLAAGRDRRRVPAPRRVQRHLR